MSFREYREHDISEYLSEEDEDSYGLSDANSRPTSRLPSISNDSSDVIEDSFEEKQEQSEPSDDFEVKTFPEILTINDSFDETRADSVSPILPNSEKVKSEKVLTSTVEYLQQKEKVEKCEAELNRAKSLMSSLQLDKIHDKGANLLKRIETFERTYEEAKQVYSLMVVKEEKQDEKPQQSTKDTIYNKWVNGIVSKPSGPSKPVAEISKSFNSGDLALPLKTFSHQGGVLKTENIPGPNLQWESIEAGISAVQPKTFGKKGIQTYNTQRALTVERLEQLHKSLEKCPADNEITDDPKGLKVELMVHQKKALTWLIHREEQKPSGGILADDMGLGKTLTMISLVLKKRQLSSDKDDNDENDEVMRDYKYRGGTLIICPASLLAQWTNEVDSKLKRGLLSHYTYHGPKRETKAKRLTQYDIVVTTYSLVKNDCENDGPLFRTCWERIIIDEAHQIRNHKSQTSTAVCQIASRSRWALTGTPIQNKELDLYALLKFLRCTPFDDLNVWKRWVGDKSAGGTQRLHTVTSSLMLRRTKVELIKEGSLNALPTREWMLIKVTLDAEEREIYQRILIFSRTMFAQFLHQRAAKNQDAADVIASNPMIPLKPNAEYFKIRDELLKKKNIKDIKQHEILVLILRLRQICCHPYLITTMLEGNEDLGQSDEEGTVEDADLLTHLDNLNLNNDDDDTYRDGANTNNLNVNTGGLQLKVASKKVLDPSKPVFKMMRRNSKLVMVLDHLKKILTTEDKVVIVSQFTSYLRLISLQLKEDGIKHVSLTGEVPTQNRMVVVDTFNDRNNSTKVMLLSLAAGGVGLNLVGGNHLFLLDLHWNPQLESQAQDRIYRVGQTKPVNIYKFMVVESIEERINDIQQYKLEMADNILTGSKKVGNKLTLKDLRLLFEM